MFYVNSDNISDIPSTSAPSDITAVNEEIAGMQFFMVFNLVYLHY